MASSKPDPLAQARALAYQSLGQIEAASDLLSEAEKLAGGTAFPADVLEVGHLLADVREAIMVAADRLEGWRRERDAPSQPRTLTERILAGETAEKPGPLEIAAFVDGFESEPTEGWERRVAEDVALWLLQQQPEVMATLRSLIEEWQARNPTAPVWLVDVAKRRVD